MGPDDLVPSDVSLVGVYFQMVKRATDTPFGRLAYVIQVAELSAYLLTNMLKALLEDWHKVKVMCDVHQAASWLHEYGIKLCKCVNLQLLYEDLVDANVRVSSIESIKNYCSPSGAPHSVNYNPLKLAHLLMVHTEWTGDDDGLRATQHRLKQPGQQQQTQQQLGPDSGNPPY